MSRLSVAMLSLAFIIIIAHATSVHAQDYRQLTPLLVDLKGWSAEPAEGMNMDMGAFKMINAVRNYTQDSKELEAMVMIGNQMMNQGAMGTMHAESDDAVMNMDQLDGFKVYTLHDKNENAGNVTVFLAKKESQEAMFVITYQGISESEAMSLARQFNWNQMKSSVEKMF